jgi:hypothetical protein
MIGMKIDVHVRFTSVLLKVGYAVIIGHFVSITSDTHEF